MPLGGETPVRLNRMSPNSPQRQERARTGEVADGAIVGTGCTNEANFRHERRWAQAGAGPIAPNKPNLPRTGRNRPWRLGPQALPPRGTIAPNKANFTQSGTKDKYFAGKELWCTGLTRGLGQTKPIPARAAMTRGRQGCRCRRWGKRAKQSQFPGSGRRDGIRHHSRLHPCGAGSWIELYRK